MSKKFSILLIAVVILINTACTILPWVKDPNNIYDWFAKPIEGTHLYYKYIYFNDFTNYTSTDNYDVIIMDIDERTDKIVCMISRNDQTRYIVADSDEGIVFYGKDEYFSGYDEEEVYIETPISIDNKWIDNSEERKISAIDTTVEVEAGIFSDVIKVKIYEDDYTGFYYYSKSRGILYREINYSSGDYEKTELIDISE